ncbi:MAG: TerC family protein [Bacteroides sp.]|nr:TerC family protein [Bacteroides sp.]
MTEILHTFLNPTAWIALLTLVFLEVVLGIDNMVFLSIMTSRLPARQQPHARTIGLFLAMLARITLLFGISLLMRLTRPLFTFHTHWIEGGVTGQSLIVLLGGLFLLYKSVTEIHHKFENQPHTTQTSAHRSSFWQVILVVVALDIVFSFDSVLTAIGMISFKEYGYTGAMTIMVTAIVLSVMVMIWFSGPISRFVNTHPTIQMLALSFLILIAVMLLVDAAHLAGITLLGKEIHDIPKGYIYFAIAFSLAVEMLNMKLRKNRQKKTVSRKLNKKKLPCCSDLFIRIIYICHSSIT